MNKLFWHAIILLILIISFTCACDSTKEYEDIPPLEQWINGLYNQMNEEQVEEGKRVLGQIDTLHIVSQILGGGERIKEQILTDSMEIYLNKMIPDLIIDSMGLNTESSLLIQLDITKRSDNIYYGYSRIELWRKVEIEKTNHMLSTQIWDDIIPICEKDNPKKRIWWALKLHAVKFAAMWTITNKEF